MFTLNIVCYCSAKTCTVMFTANRESPTVVESIVTQNGKLIDLSSTSQTGHHRFFLSPTGVIDINVSSKLEFVKIFLDLWVFSRLFESDLKNELELNFWTAVLTTRKSHNELNLLHVTDVIIIVFDTFVSIYRILNFININFRRLDYQSLHRKLKKRKTAKLKTKAR